MRQTALDKPPMRDRKSPVPGWRDASFGLSVTQMGVVEGPPRGRNRRLPPDHDSSTAPRSVSANACAVAGRNGLGSDSTDAGGGQGRRPGRPRSGVGRYDLRGPLRQVVGRISGVPSTWGPGDFHRRRRRAPRPRAAGIAGQLPRVRGRTPGLPPAGRPPVTSAVRPACSERPRIPDGDQVWFRIAEDCRRPSSSARRRTVGSSPVTGKAVRSGGLATRETT